MNEGDKVKWVDGLGFEHKGTVAFDGEFNDYMIPVTQADGTVIRIAYKNLNLDMEGI